MRNKVKLVFSIVNECSSPLWPGGRSVFVYCTVTDTRLGEGKAKIFMSMLPFPTSQMNRKQAVKLAMPNS